MITIFLPSYDRACQLDFLLRTIFNFFPHNLINKICIGYSYSNDDYYKGYQRLISEQNLVSDFCQRVWIDERSQNTRFHKFLQHCNSDYLMIITDDSFFYRDVQLTKEELDTVLNDDEVFSFSFRLGKNTIKVNQWVDDICQIGNLEDNGKFIKWNWYQSSSHFNHPLAIDGNLYRLEDFKEVYENSDTNSFTSWEGSSNHYYKNKSRNKCKMAAFSQSVLLNMPINAAEYSHSKFGVYYPRSNKDLNERYLAGEIINFNSIDLSNVEYCQWELSLNTIKIC